MVIDDTDEEEVTHTITRKVITEKNIDIATEISADIFVQSFVETSNENVNNDYKADQQTPIETTDKKIVNSSK